MALDSAARRNLELTVALQPDPKSSRSLFGVLDVEPFGENTFRIAALPAFVRSEPRE
jgi:hypothetical protein